MPPEVRTVTANRSSIEAGEFVRLSVTHYGTTADAYDCELVVNANYGDRTETVYADTVISTHEPTTTEISVQLTDSGTPNVCAFFNTCEHIQTLPGEDF